MTDKKFSDEFANGKDRLDEIGRRLGAAFGNTKSKPDSAGSGIFTGLGHMIEQLGKLVEQAEQAGGVVNKSGDFKFGSNPQSKGVYGFSVKSALGDERVKVEPFGNIRKDTDGKLIAVHEIREPILDVFDEPDRLLIVAEVPGIEERHVRVELHDDILVISTVKGEPNYGKEVLLPSSFTSDKLNFECRNGILKIELRKDSGGV
jgi:HSP20 family protein